MISSTVRSDRSSAPKQAVAVFLFHGAFGMAQRNRPDDFVAQRRFAVVGIGATPKGRRISRAIRSTRGNRRTRPARTPDQRRHAPARPRSAPASGIGDGKASVGKHVGQRPDTRTVDHRDDWRPAVRPNSTEQQRQPPTGQTQEAAAPISVLSGTLHHRLARRPAAPGTCLQPAARRGGQRGFGRRPTRPTIGQQPQTASIRTAGQEQGRKRHGMGSPSSRLRGKGMMRQHKLLSDASSSTCV